MINLAHAQADYTVELHVRSHVPIQPLSDCVRSALMAVPVLAGLSDHIAQLAYRAPRPDDDSRWLTHRIGGVIGASRNR